jgi:hypothetical protein
MSANQNVDGVCDFFTALASKLITNFGPAALSFLVWVLETWKIILRQLQKTVHAIIDSFYNERIVFYEDNEVYYPSIEKEYGGRTFMTGCAEWKYIIATNTFIKMGNTTRVSEHSIDFLGAALLRDGEHVGDLSEWILDQKILSDSSYVPFQVIVGAWAYCNHIELHYNYPDYTVTIMTMEGDEKVIDLKTGEEIVEEVGDARLPASPRSEASIESHDSLEEGEIPTPHYTHTTDSSEESKED